MILCNHDRQQLPYLLLTYLCSAKLNITSWIQVSRFEKAPPPEWTSTLFLHPASSNTSITNGLDFPSHMETSVEPFAAGR